jgi:hypothetical protein
MPQYDPYRSRNPVTRAVIPILLDVPITGV